MKIKISKKKILGFLIMMTMIFSVLISATACNCDLDKSLRQPISDISYQQKHVQEIKSTGNRRMGQSLLSYNIGDELLFRAGLRAKSVACVGPSGQQVCDSEEDKDGINTEYMILSEDGGEWSWSNDWFTTDAHKDITDNSATASANGLAKLRLEATPSYINISGNLDGDYFAEAADTGPTYEGWPCPDIVTSDAYARFADYEYPRAHIPFNLAESCTKMCLEADLLIDGPQAPEWDPTIDATHEVLIEWRLKDGIYIEASGSIYLDDVSHTHISGEYDIQVQYPNDFKLDVDITNFEHLVSAFANGCDNGAYQGPNWIGGSVNHSYYLNFTFFEDSSCPADFDGDGDVDTADLLYLLGAWGTPDGDVDGDGDTDTSDLLMLLAAWGPCS